MTMTMTMTMYAAIVNVPGYLPTDDEPPTFETPREAWEYLRDVRQDDEENYPGCYLSETWHQLDRRATGADVQNSDQAGTVYGPTPGYEGEHDLGLAYCVVEVEA